jgi:FKBP-type peptidyl-prolyl cis-trans isomerase
MKTVRSISLFMLLSCALVFAQGGVNTGKKSMFASKIDSASYVVGQIVAAQFGQLNADLVLRGLNDALKGESVIPQDQFNALLSWCSGEVQRASLEANKQEGVAFLAKNKTEPGVVTLPSGLQYKVIREGAGAPPKSSNTVTVHYEGRLINGKVFDSSYQRGQVAAIHSQRPRLRRARRRAEHRP